MAVSLGWHWKLLTRKLSLCIWCISHFMDSYIHIYGCYIEWLYTAWILFKFYYTHIEKISANEILWINEMVAFESFVILNSSCNPECNKIKFPFFSRLRNRKKRIQFKQFCRSHTKKNHTSMCYAVLCWIYKYFCIKFNSGLCFFSLVAFCLFFLSYQFKLQWK